jgi:hypothetical protein
MDIKEHGGAQGMSTDRFDSEPFAMPRRRIPAPFYTEALPCESCGRPAETRTLDVDSGLWIGVDCPCITEPDEPQCPALEGPILRARNVREIVQACKAHREYCPLCNPVQRKGIAPAPHPEMEPERKAA